MNEVHGNQKPHKCQNCSKKFTNANILRRHNKAVHQKIKDFVCERCTNSLLISKFSSKENLKIHNIKVHEDGLMLACEFCSKSYPNKSQLNRHINSVFHKNDRKK